MLRGKRSWISSRGLGRLLAALGLAVLLGLAGRSTAAQTPRPWQGSGAKPAGVISADATVRAVLAVGLTVSDMERSVDFYTRILTFETISDVEVAGPAYERLTGVFGVRMRVVTLKLGEEQLVLTEYLASPGRPAPVGARSNDRWFQHVAIIVSDMDRAYQVLRANRVHHASTGPQLLPQTIPNAAGIRAFYFRDPDGHPLEILAFPPDKGDPKWHRPSDRLFLGIDHTAIVVSDTERSLRFYRDLLGLRVAGESHNFGAEQEHLNNVEGADLHITGLRAPSGPGIEFLEYLNPRDGRPMPADEHPNDLVHWQTTLLVDRVTGALGGLGTSAPVVSRGAASPPEGNLGFADGILVRDPDGHVLLLVDR